jgi:ABC-2 type transport system permease protein
VSLLARLIPTPVRAILVKDLLLYRRDLRSISKLLTPLILGVVYAVSMVQSGGRVPRGAGNAPAWVMDTLQGVLLYGDVALALFVGWLLAANLAGSGVSLEGKNYWMIKVAPLKPRQFLLAKFLVAYLPTVLICGVYVLVLQVFKGPNAWSMLVSLLAVALLLAGVNGLYLAFGVLGAKFDWENPNQIGRSVGCLGSLAGMLYMPLCFGLFIGPILLATLLNFPVVLGQAVGLALGGAAGIAGALIPLKLVEKRVSKLNEV